MSTNHDLCQWSHKYGKDYRYANDYPEALVNQGYLPSDLREHFYYRLLNQSHERIIKERLDKWL
ncbi:MAG: hypothetical protein JRI67_07600 [Deltaproteobacteria bacterium]|nr:hypothetical protein [Deltaproteobacteria bacterium]